MRVHSQNQINSNRALRSIPFVIHTFSSTATNFVASVSLADQSCRTVFVILAANLNLLTLRSVDNSEYLSHAQLTPLIVPNSDPVRTKPDSSTVRLVKCRRPLPEIVTAFEFA